MTDEHTIRIRINEQVSVRVILDMSEQFTNIMDVFGCMFIDAYGPGTFCIDIRMSLDEVRALKDQFDWAITSYCDMDQDSGQDFVYLADHD